MLVRRALGQVPDYFELLSFRVIDERRFNAKGELVTDLRGDDQGLGRRQRNFYTVADGNGPVNALDPALRQALAETYPALERHAADRLQGAHPGARSRAPPR